MQSRRFGVDRLARVLDELGRVAGELRRAPDARLALEVALTRVARPESDLTLESLAERVAMLEAALAGFSFGASGAPKPAPTPRPAVAPAAKAAPAEAHMPAAPVPAPPAPAAPAAATDSAPIAAPAPLPEPASAPAPAPVAEAPAKAATRTPSATPADVAELRRRWKDVLRAVKEVKPATSKLFMNTVADLDGDTVVVEFAPDARVFKKMAEDQEVTAILREAIAAVLGWHVGLRYQLGRGEVRAGSDTVSNDPPAPSGAATDHDALDRALLEGLGAAVVEPGNDD